MKTKFLLSVFALCCAMFMSTDAMAQWAEPMLPELQEVNATEIESGKTYYIKNVGAEQQLGVNIACNKKVGVKK